MPTKHNALTDIITRQQIMIERLKSGEAREYIAALQKLDPAIAEVVGALSEEIGQVTRKELLRVLAKLEEINAEVIEKANKGLMKRFGEFADYQVEFESAMYGVVAPSLRIAIPKAGVAYARALANPVSDVGLLEPFVESYGQAEVKRLNNQVLRAWGEGWTNQKLIQSIRGTKALNYKDGVLAITRRNAETVARTGVQHVATQARMAVMEENADVIEKYQIVATLDGKTSAKCRSLDGQQFEFGKGPVPPLHPRCRSAVAPVPDEEFAFLRKGGTRSSMNGYVDQDLSYYEWLKTQPKAFQDEAIGPTRGKLLRDGGLSGEEFARLNLNKNFEPLSLDEMRKKNPQIFETAGLN